MKSTAVNAIPEPPEWRGPYTRAKRRAVEEAIDKGGGQATDIAGIIAALFAMDMRERIWLAEELSDWSKVGWPAPTPLTLPEYTLKFLTNDAP